MKIGLAEWGLREYPLEEHFELTRNLAVGYLEIGCGAEHEKFRLPQNPSHEQITQLNNLAREYHIDTTFGAIGGGYAIEDKEQLKQMIAEQKLELSSLHLLGVKIVRIFASWTPMHEMNETKWDQMMTALTELDGFAASKDIKLAIETHGTLSPKGVGFGHLHNVTTDWTSLERLIKALPAHTGILFDPGNLRAVCDRPLEDYVDLLNEHIIACHIKDWKQNIDGSWNTVAIGETAYDWAPIFEKMKYSGVGLIEYEDTSDVLEGMSRSIDYLESIGFRKE